MIRFRALAIAAGHPDANDCDTLRADPAFKMAVGRLPESGADLCSQPTITRRTSPCRARSRRARADSLDGSARPATRAW